MLRVQRSPHCGWSSAIALEWNEHAKKDTHNDRISKADAAEDLEKERSANNMRTLRVRAGKGEMDRCEKNGRRMDSRFILPDGQLLCKSFQSAQSVEAFPEE